MYSKAFPNHWLQRDRVGQVHGSNNPLEMSLAVQSVVQEWNATVASLMSCLQSGYRQDVLQLVGGWATPLKNMKVNWDDDYSQYMGN